LNTPPRRLAAALCAASLGFAAALPARAQFQSAPTPLKLGDPPPSQAPDARAYRADGARHLYYAYPMLVQRGQMPPLLHAVAVVETTIDEAGAVEKVEITREPAAQKEVMPWIVTMIQRAQPYPAAARLGKVIYTEVWLVNKNGKFQLDTLTEGQVHKPPGDKD
jgi:hypothetical protein